VPELFINRIIRDLCRAAAFGWMIFFAAARSTIAAASRTAAAASPSSPPMTDRAFRTAVRAAVRTGLFRARRFSF
jgi:hypothetical protein